MAGGDDSSKFELDLDAASFIEQANKAKDALSSIGAGGELSSVVSALGSALPLVGALGVAFLAVKESVDLVFDAEKIKATNAEFENLSKNSGVASDTLKRGLTDAAHGWADQTELMTAANQALIKLETGADRLPEIMELARKATAVMGGDMIQNFDAISQAIATGSTRQLRHLGILVDTKKAYQEYATQLGVSVSELSKAGQQQAIMNAVLDQGQAKFAGINENLKPATNAWLEFKVALKDTGEIIALVWDKLFGPTVATGFQKLAGSLKGLKEWMTATFAGGSEGAQANVDLLNSRLAETEKKISDIQNKKGIGSAMTEGEAKIQLELLNIQLKHYQDELEKAGVAVKKFHVESAAGPGGSTPGAGDEAEKASMVDKQKHQAELLKQKEAMLGLDRQLNQAEIANAKTANEATALYNESLKDRGRETDLQIEKVRQQAETGVITQEQADEQIIRLNQIKNQRMRQDDQQLAQMQIQATQNRLYNETRLDQQLATSAELNARQAGDAWKKAGGLGGAAMGSFQSHAVTAFQAIGSGSKSAADAMGEAFMGVLGDMATKQGEFMMLDAFKTFPAINAPEFAAGAALVALGGALGGAAGGGAASVGGAGSSGAPGGSVGGSSSSPAPSTASSSLARQGMHQNLIFNGSVIGDEATARWITDKVRQASDATGFTVQSVNGGF